jgi:hypothetical protein
MDRRRRRQSAIDDAAGDRARGALDAVGDSCIDRITRAETNAAQSDLWLLGCRDTHIDQRSEGRRAEHVARTKLHELGHWTGHASRLDRNFSGRFGGAAYAREELVAELSSAFLCAELGVAPTVRHADYLGSWLQVLKEDNRAIFQAASLASKAADFVMGRTAIQGGVA